MFTERQKTQINEAIAEILGFETYEYTHTTENSPVYTHTAHKYPDEFRWMQYQMPASELPNFAVLLEEILRIMKKYGPLSRQEIS